MSRRNPLQPPPRLEAVVGAILPASRREQVLGDLAERYCGRSPVSVARYLLDAFGSIGHVWWSVGRRSMFGPPPRLAGASESVICARTEQLQRHLKYRSGLFVVGTLFHRSLRDLVHLSPYPWVRYTIIVLILVSILVALPLAEAPYRRRDDENPWRSPISLNFSSRAEFIELYRQTLKRLQLLEQGWGRPLIPLTLLFLWFFDLAHEWSHVRVPLPVVITIAVVFLAAGYTVCLALARWRVQRLQREIDGLGVAGSDDGEAPVLNGGVRG